jgi:phospholipase D1/2
MEEASGVTFHQAQVALSRQWIGDVSESSRDQPTKVKIKKPTETGEGIVVSDKTKTDIEEVEMPPTMEDARKIVEQFESGAASVRGDAEVSDSVAQHMLNDRTSLMDERWLGTEEEEKNA